MVMGTKRWMGGAVVLACLGTLVGAARAEQEARRFATLAPEGSLWMKQLEQGAAEVEKLTDGRIKTKFYPGGAQGGERDVVRKMRLGQLDAAGLTSIGLGMIYPGIRVLELPYLWDSVDEIDYVRKKMWPYFQEKFAEKGFELLAVSDVGWIHLFSVNDIGSLADLEATKVWAWTDDPVVRKLFKLMGLDGVPLGVPAVQPALQSGRIQAAYGSPLAAVALQWHTRVKYMSAEPFGYGLGAMVMRTEIWELGSTEDKEAQIEVGRRRMLTSIKRIRKDNARALKAMVKNGLTIIPVPEDVDAKLREKAEQLRVDLLDDVFTQEELDLVLEYRAEYRANQKKRKVSRGVRLK